jgi:kanamycin nucleotidyltransferase
MNSGPSEYTHDERMARAEYIASRFQAYYAENLVAIGIYGSLGRGLDGPYSDIEMHVIVKGEEIEHSYEWSAGLWKAEVDVYSPDIYLLRAGELDDLWPITQGAFARVLPLHDPKRLFHRAAHTVFDHTLDEYNDLIRTVLIGDLFENIGKARNAIALSKTSNLAAEAVMAARFAACVIGLANRFLYSTGPAIFPESIGLPGRPAGYDELVGMVMQGKLDNPQQVAKAMDALWEGEEAWATGIGLKLHLDLEELLTQD